MRSSNALKLPTSTMWSNALLRKLCVPEYRHAYVAAHVRTWVARKIRALREQRSWSQSELGRRCQKPQSAISRLEDPDYGQMSVQTLLDLASTLDVALIIDFVNFPSFVEQTRDVGDDVLAVDSFDVTVFADINFAASSTSNAVSVLLHETLNVVEINVGVASGLHDLPFTLTPAISAMALRNTALLYRPRGPYAS